MLLSFSLTRIYCTFASPEINAHDKPKVEEEENDKKVQVRCTVNLAISKIMQLS